MNRREIVTLSLASLSATALSPAFGQVRFPERPIRLLVPFSAGGVVDAVARQWADRVKPHLGTIVIENQGGAGGTIATGEAARAAPDGYTALLANTSIMVLNPAIMPKVPYDPVRDFAPISILAISASGIMINPSVPAKNLKEFIAYAKANADKLSYGSAGTGTMTQLAGELFKLKIGAPDITHVPYRGAGPSIADLVARRSRRWPDPDGDHQRDRPARGAAPRRQDSHSCGHRAGAAQGRAGHPDRGRGRDAGHDRTAIHGTVPAGQHPKAHYRSGLRGLAEGHDRPGDAAGTDRAGPRPDYQFEPRQGAGLHRGGGRALDAGGESRWPEGGVMVRANNAYRTV